MTCTPAATQSSSCRAAKSRNNKALFFSKRFSVLILDRVIKSWRPRKSSSDTDDSTANRNDAAVIERICESARISNVVQFADGGIYQKNITITKVIFAKIA